MFKNVKVKNSKTDGSYFVLFDYNSMWQKSTVTY